MLEYAIKFNRKYMKYDLIMLSKTIVYFLFLVIEEPLLDKFIDMAS